MKKLGPATEAIEALSEAGSCCALGLGAERLVQSAWGACAELLGQPPEALVGRPARDLLLVPHALEEAAGSFAVVARATGRRLLAIAAPVGDAGAKRLLLFDTALDAADASLPAALAGAAAHDLRNPLAAIKLNLQALSRSPSDERVAKRLSIALREVGTLEHALEALAECGRPAPVAQICPPADLARAAARACQADLAACGASLRLDLAASLPLVRAELDRVPLALATLARAVARATLEASITLSVAAAPGVAVRFGLSAPGLLPPRSRSLAMALAHRVAEDYQGRFAVEGSATEACFALYLPVG